MTKAISTVIASTLILMIVIGLGSTAYLFIAGTFTSKTATTFELIDAISDTVIIRNSGTDSITRITATLDGSTVKTAVIPNINPITNDLVAYYKMNEGSGFATEDNSGNNNGGSLNNFNFDANSGWVDGVEGKALRFDGSNDYVRILDRDMLSFTDKRVTVSVWVKTSFSRPGGNEGYILTKGTGAGGYEYGFSQQPRTNFAGFSFWTLGGGGAGNDRGTTALNDGTWHHVLVVADGSKIRVYVDGNRDDPGDGETLGTVSNTDADLTIGGRMSNDNMFNGIIDEVFIYNRALSEDEVKQLYSGLVPAGQLATIKPLSPLSKGTHTLRLCTSSMCNTAILTIN